MTDEVVEKARPGTLLLTPLALALVMVETTDLIFAVDSIPAIFAITGDASLGFHQQRLCDPRSPVALFRAGGDGEEVPLPEGLARPGPDGRGRQDADCRMAEDRPREALQPVLAIRGARSLGGRSRRFAVS